MKLCLKDLSNTDLLKNTKACAQSERDATTILLHHLIEVERRRLFSEVGCSSLFDYCVRVLKMSEPQAARRVNAARILCEIPEVEAKIQEGSLSVTTLSQAQGYFRKERKLQENESLSTSDKLELLEKLENKSTRQVEKILVSESSEPLAMKPEKVRFLTESLSEIKIVLDEETLQELQKLKDIWSLEGGYQELIQKMAKLCLKHSDPLEKAKRAKHREEKRSRTPAPELKVKKKTERHRKSVSQVTKASRHIPNHVKHQVYLRDHGQCTYQDPAGRSCGSRHRPQLDHITPFAHGGAHTTENLRLRCFTHNQLYARQVFGIGLDGLVHRPRPT